MLSALEVITLFRRLGFDVYLNGPDIVVAHGDDARTLKANELGYFPVYSSKRLAWASQEIAAGNEFSPGTAWPWIAEITIP